jgi:hypothetical protein
VKVIVTERAVLTHTLALKEELGIPLLSVFAVERSAVTMKVGTKVHPQ